jgi:hypothetical protein
MATCIHNDEKTKKPLGEHEWKELETMLNNGHSREADVLRRVRAAGASYTLTCAQVIKIANKTKGCWCDTVVLLHKSISDKSNFATVLDNFQWAEERTEVLEKLGLTKEQACK